MIDIIKTMKMYKNFIPAHIWPNHFLRFWLVVFGITFFSFFIPNSTLASSEPQNLISNSSVETANTQGTAPLSWQSGRFGRNTAIFTYPVDGADGARAVKIDVTQYTSGDAKWYFDDVTVIPGQQYIFSDSYISTIKSQLVVRFKLTNGAFQYLSIGNIDAALLWTATQAKFTAPINAISATVFHRIKNLGSLTTDNFSLTPYDDIIAPPVPDPANLISNPSLETADLTGIAPDKWRQGNWGANTAVFTYPVAGQDGLRAAKIDVTQYTDGDAKWYFDEVPVMAQSYIFSDYYIADVPTVVVVRYTFADNSVQYIDLGAAPIAPSWRQFAVSFTAPANVVSLTVLHLINSVGSIIIDNYSLRVSSEEENPNKFSEGMVSLTFDDGWLSQYENARPILNSSGVKGTFYIISDEPQRASAANLIQNPSLETADLTGIAPDKWRQGNWGANTAVFTYPVAGQDGLRAAKIDVTQYTDGDAKWYFDEVPVMAGQNYKFADYYNATVASSVIIRYTFNDATTQYVNIGDIPATGGLWNYFEKKIIAPSNITSITIFHLINSVGSLTVDNYSFAPVQLYMNIPQVVALQTDGHEIGAHTKTHPDLTAISTAQAQTEIAGSRSDLLAMGAAPVSAFAYPYGAYNETLEQIVYSAGMNSARTTMLGYNLRNTDKYALKTQAVIITTALDEVKLWVDSAKANKTWLVIMFHQVDNAGDVYGTTPQNLQNIANYIASQQIKTVTMSQGLGLMNP